LSLMIDGLFVDNELFDDDRGHPPTSRRFLREWPRITVTSRDVERGAECAVCLARLVEDEVGLRLPCGHLYHGVCVKVWLQMSHLCPVCRFELPTDDSRRDAARRAAMKSRRPRFRREDLVARTQTELRHLAQYFDVRVKEQMQKEDVVHAIVASGRIEVISGDSPSSADKGIDFGHLCWNELRSAHAADRNADAQRGSSAAGKKHLSSDDTDSILRALMLTQGHLTRSGFTEEAQSLAAALEHM